MSHKRLFHCILKSVVIPRIVAWLRLIFHSFTGASGFCCVWPAAVRANIVSLAMLTRSAGNRRYHNLVLLVPLSHFRLACAGILLPDLLRLLVLSFASSLVPAKALLRVPDCSVTSSWGPAQLKIHDTVWW
jgi:hypothetical protein